jgi:TatD DNase family protein
MKGDPEWSASKGVHAMLVDTHAHLCDPVFDVDRDLVIARAKTSGIGITIAVGEDLADGRKNLELAARHPEIRPALGIYPTRLDLAEAHEMVGLIRRERERVVAIGEVGLDHWAVKGEAEHEIQREILGQFIDLSVELGLPLNVHSRAAGRHVLSLLLSRNARKVQLHAFDGKAASALPGVEAGYYFSIPPSIVRSRQKQRLVKSLPLSCLLVETDSPVLGPLPNERNEPANAVLCIDAIAEIKGLSREAVMEAVAENSRRLYGDFV